MTNYDIIAKVIGYITSNPKVNLSLEQLAEFVQLSPTHLQKTFTDWCGVSPKQFSRFLSLSYAKELLAQNKNNLQTTILSGLSSTGRLHDLFVDIEAMTPFEFRNGGENLSINYSFQDSIFGNYIVASTEKGICNILFFDDKDLGLDDLHSRWNNAKLIEKEDNFQKKVIEFFDRKDIGKIKLHLHGTNFQLKVWEALLSIPEGRITNYGSIARQIGDHKMSRAVGTAIGDNPIGYLIPCHRVLQSTGAISGYRWGVGRKKVILGWESTRKEYKVLEIE
jgi:AraC family transcriptional regulator, regulatory protein of adaptative response / methylated-DNA-[protein]-cysteine methyltransferase